MIAQRSREMGSYTCDVCLLTKSKVVPNQKRCDGRCKREHMRLKAAGKIKKNGLQNRIRRRVHAF